MKYSAIAENQLDAILSKVEFYAKEIVDQAEDKSIDLSEDADFRLDYEESGYSIEKISIVDEQLSLLCIQNSSGIEKEIPFRDIDVSTKITLLGILEDLSE